MVTYLMELLLAGGDAVDELHPAILHARHPLLYRIHVKRSWPQQQWPLIQHFDLHWCMILHFFTKFLCFIKSMNLFVGV